MKKRTVWFLTLVCLMAVISVYYIFERPSDFNLTTIFTDEALDKTVLTGADKTDTVQTDHYAFDEIRLQMSNERSQLREQYTERMASSEASAEEKSAAYTALNTLIERDSSEAMLEMLVKELGYTEALVRIDDDKVAVTVMSDEMSKQQANEIIYTVKSELSDVINVSVNIQSDYY